MRCCVGDWQIPVIDRGIDWQHILIETLGQMIAQVDWHLG